MSTFLRSTIDEEVQISAKCASEELKVIIIVRRVEQLLQRVCIRLCSLRRAPHTAALHSAILRQLASRWKITVPAILARFGLFALPPHFLLCFFPCAFLSNSSMFILVCRLSAWSQKKIPQNTRIYQLPDKACSVPPFLLADHRL